MTSQTPPTATQYSRLQQAYDFFNAELFGGQLPPCLITLQRQKRVMGYFSRRRFVDAEMNFTDEIAMNPEFFGREVVVEVLQTIVHEMCHLWQCHFGKPGRRAYHNQEWADKMESIGLMPSSTGKPGGSRTGEKMGDYPIDGGAFLEAAQRLLAEEFDIPWADRYSAAAPALLGPATGPTAGNGGQGALPTTGPGAKPQERKKTKYTCPTCAANVWGKPGLVLGCIPCEKVMTPA